MTAPSWMTTRLPIRTRSRIETRAWMTQSSPICAPRPIVDVRMHDRARADPRAVADDRERTDRRVRRRASRRRRRTASGGCRAAGATDRANSSTALANARYGCAVAQHRARRRFGAARRGSRPRRASRAAPRAYLGLAKKVRSPGPASSMPATRWISISPSPSSRQPRRSAMSLSFKTRSIRGSTGGSRTIRSSLRSARKTGEVLEPETQRDVADVLHAPLRVEADGATQLRQRRALARCATSPTVEAVPRAPHREVVADQAEGEVVGEDVGPGHEHQQPGQRRSRPNRWSARSGASRGRAQLRAQARASRLRLESSG